MNVRRIVTGNVNGKSTVVSDSAAPEVPMAANVWAADRECALGFDPAEKPLALEPSAGGSSWRIVEWPPDAVYRAQMAKHRIEGLESEDFHRTSTLDYVMILEGEMELALDTGSVVLRAGDCVVQRATNHAWYNRTDRPVRMLVVMISLEPRVGS